MSDFKVFETNRRANFLSKAKEVKVKREEEIKKAQAVLLLQKNLRAFMVFRKHDSPHYPLFMNIYTSANQHQAIIFWESIITQPSILRTRFVRQAIRALTCQEDLPTHPNLETTILEFSQQKELKQAEYEAILRVFWKGVSGTYIDHCFDYYNFEKALRTILKSLHKLVDLVVRVEKLDLAIQLLSLYFQQCIREEQKNQETLINSHYKAVSLLETIMQGKQTGIKVGGVDKNMVVDMISLLFGRMRRFYMGLLRRIKQGLFESVSLQEVDKLLKEKPEWEGYQSHPYPICQFIPTIMECYISREAKQLSQALDLSSEVTKLGEQVVSLNITMQQFFFLLERLSSRGEREGESRNYELLVVVIMVEKYLQGLNDLRFYKAFRNKSDRLKEFIRSSIIRFVKGLTIFTDNQQITRQIYRYSIAFLSNLYNKIFRTNLLPTSVFQDSSINSFPGNQKYSNYGNANYIKEMDKIVELCPFLLPINTRFLVFRKLLKEDGPTYHQNDEQSIITINRGNEFEEAMAQLYHLDIRSHFYVRFIDSYGQKEKGMDAGGLTKELLTHIFKIAFDPSFQRFIENERKELLPNPDYWRIEEGQLAKEYEFIGRLLGKSLRENIVLGVKFAGPFLNLLVNNRNSFDDLLLIDPDLYRSLASIMEMQEGVEDLCLTFQYQDSLTKQVVNLKPAGEHEIVNNNNKTQYVNLIINYKVNRLIERQTSFVRKGLKTVINDSWFRMFNYSQLNYLFSGTGKIDVNDWIKFSKVQGGQNTKNLIQNFWSVVEEMEEEEKSLLLKFVTSYQRPSFLGFKDLHPPFTIRVTKKDDNLLPVSRTSINILDLPEYSNKKILKEKLLYAIKSNAGFQLT